MAPSPARTPTPEELVLRYRDRGDAEAIAALFDTTAPHLFHVAQAIAPDAATAEDALQETYLQALESIDRWDAARPVVPWLVGILRLKVHEVRRRVRRAPDPARVASPSPQAEPCDLAGSREDEALVHAALEDLPEPYRNVAILRWRYGLTPAQIAHARDEPPGTVGSLLSRALTRLRTTLSGVPAVFHGVRAPRGIDAVRERVVRAASAARAVPSGAAGSAVGVGLAGAGVSVVGGALMAKKAVGLVVVAAGLLALGGWRFLLPSKVDPSASPIAAPRQVALEARPAAAAPDLAGSPHAKERALPVAGRPAAAAPLAAAASIHGLVRDEEGEPVPDAVVYAMPKGAPGFDDLDTHPHAVTSLDGAFRFDLPFARGHWIGTVAPGRLPAFVDGDGLDPATSLTILLKTGPELTVRAVDAEGRPVVGATVYLAPAPGEGVRRFPVPDGPGGAYAMATTGDDGRVRLSASTEGPVDVGLSPPNTNLRTEPDGIRLERAGGQVEFRVVPSCTLRVRVLDATTGRAFEGPFGFTLRKPGTDTVITGFSTSNPDGTGIGDLTMGVAPGTYDVEVSAAGRRPDLLSAVAFDRPGASREFTASLATAGERTAGRMVLTWSDVADAASPTSAEAEEADGWGHEILLRRTAPDRTAWFSPLSAEGFTILKEIGRARFDAAHRITTIDLLVPGTYDVLAWHRAADRCAFARDVRVPGDNTATARLALRAGVRVPVKDLAGPTTLIKGLVLEGEPLGRLPAFRWFPGGWGTFEPEDEIDPTYVLGPYPFATVTATFPGPDGAAKRVVVGAKEPVPASR